MSFCFQIVVHKLLHYLLNNDPKIAILTIQMQFHYKNKKLITP